MNEKIFSKENLEKIALLRYGKINLFKEDLTLFKKENLIKDNFHLTELGYDLAYVAKEYLQLMKLEESEVFKFIDVEQKKVLDAGCGGGAYSFKAIELGAERVIGVDSNKNYIQIANEIKTIRGFQNVSFLLDDVESMATVKNSFDVIISRLVIPYIDLEKFLFALNSKTHRGSIMFIKYHALPFYFENIKDNLKKKDLIRLGYSFFAIINGVLENYLNQRFSLKIRGRLYKDIFYTRKYLEKKLCRYRWKIIKQNWEENKKTPYIIVQKF